MGAGVTDLWRWLGVLCAASLLAVSALAGDFSAKITDKGPPKQIGEWIRAVLQPKAVELLNKEKAVMDIWLRQEIPLRADAPKLESIGETTLVGAVEVLESGLKDYKDNEIPKGVYTARFANQPSDGDHLGTAEITTFLVLLGADIDKELNGFDKFRPMVKASGKLTSSGHPVVLNLRPASDSKESPSVTEPAPEHKAVRLKLRLGKGEAVCDLVFEGHGHIQ
jgi:hypothetical protein